MVKTCSANEQTDSTQKHYPFIQISDVHFFSENADLSLLLRFLQHIKSCETFIINGDLVEMWKEPNNFSKERLKLILDCIGEVNRLAEKGTTVLYTLGNHDTALRERYNKTVRHILSNKINKRITLYNPIDKEHLTSGAFTNIHIADSAIYTTPKGEKILICHGDQFDEYYADIQIKDHIFEIPYKIPSKLPRNATLVKEFHIAIIQAAKSGGYDGVSYGHTHLPEIQKLDGKFCLNAGDWIEHHTALTHDEDGNWTLLKAKEMNLPPIKNTSQERRRTALRQQAELYTVARR